MVLGNVSSSVSQVLNLPQIVGKVKNPKIVTRIQYINRDVETKIDGIVVKDSTVKFRDSYPTKENPTISYEGEINLITKQGKGKFNFKPQNLDLIISETETGLWKSTLKTDSEYVIINSLDVQSLPSVTKEQKVDNWGVLGGVKFNTTLNESDQNLELLGGIRYKKIFVIGSANTNKQIGIGTLFEF
jgi:hypothetical protein